MDVMEERRLIPVTGVNADGTPYSGTMYETIHAPTKDTPMGIKWNTCSVCLMDFPETEMMRIKGRWYCRKYKCFEDTLPKEYK